MLVLLLVRLGHHIWASSGPSMCGSWLLDYVSEMPKQLKMPEDLVRTEPDPMSDRDLLVALRDPASAATQSLAEHLRTDEACCISPLRELLPGLSLVEAPNFTIRLSERAANPLLRAGAGSLRSLAPRTPDELRQIPLVGAKVAREILAVTLSEWAAAYLREDEEDQRVDLPQHVDVSDPLSSHEYQRRLSETLDEIEGATGFEAFRHRRLDLDASPTQSEVADAVGLKPGQVAHYEKAIDGKLARQMQDEDSPLFVAVAALKDRIGALARLPDLERTFAVVDPFERAMPKDAPQRRALLLLLAGLRVTDDWIVDVEIEEIVDALLKGLTEPGPASLDVIDRQLGRLGVRQDLRLPWVVGRSGYRVVEQKLVRVGGD